MSSAPLSRRQALRGGAALAGAAILPIASARAAQASLTATTFPGAWEEAQRRFLLPPAEKATGAQITLTASQAVDTVTKLAATKGNPPFDVVMMDEGPFMQGVDLGLFSPIVTSAAPNLAKLPPRFLHPQGLGAYVSAQVFGIAYNTDRIKTAPTRYEDLLLPIYKGRVGLVGLDSTLGTVWMVALAKMLGGDEEHMDPAFDFIAKLLPNVGAVASNPGALGTMFQTGQIDIACHYLNNVASLAAKDVPVALTRPASGWGIVRSLMCVTKGSQVPELASRYIDTALSVPVQTAMAGAPYYLAPTNTAVPFGAEMAKIAHSAAEMDQFVQTDWGKLNPRRASYIDRFNRLVKK